jgi:hypothetical protein
MPQLTLLVLKILLSRYERKRLQEWSCGRVTHLHQTVSAHSAMGNVKMISIERLMSICQLRQSSRGGRDRGLAADEG